MHSSNTHTEKHMCGSHRCEWHDCCYVTSNLSVHKSSCSASQSITNDAVE